MFDFPNTPTTGQAASNGMATYRWDGTKWAVSGSSVAGGASITIGDTPPSTPTSGSMWFDSVGAQTYLWYPDPNSAAWVPMNAPPPATTVAFLPLSGGTLTGALVLAADPVTALQPATKQYTDNAITTALIPYARLASPALTGTPTAPTATAGTSTTQLATTAFVASAISGSLAGVTSWNGRTGIVAMTLADVTNVGGAPLVSPALTGTPTTPTATSTDNSTNIASTAYVQSQISAAWRPVVQSSTIKAGVNLIGNVGPQTDSSSPWATFTGGDSFAMGSAFYNFYVVNYNRNGGTGHRQSFTGIMNVHASTDNGFNVGCAGFAYADAGGPNQICGMNSYAQTSGTASQTAVISFEANTDVRVSGSPVKSGVQVIDVNTSTQDGVTTSAGIIIACQNGAIGYKNALQFGLDVGTNSSPVPASGTLIRTAQTWTCSRGIDFRNTTFSVAALDMLPGQPGASAFDGNTIAWAGGPGGKITNRTSTNGPRVEFQANALQFWNNARSLEAMEIQTDIQGVAFFGLTYPATTAAIDLGNTSNRWRTLYCSTSPNVSSDPALKRNIQRLPSTLSLVARIDPIRWQWKDGDDDRINWGFSAPEVKAAFDDIDEDFAGVDDHSLRYGDLIAVLWKAVQELSSQMTKLRNV